MVEPNYDQVDYGESSVNRDHEILHALIAAYDRDVATAALVKVDADLRDSRAGTQCTV